MWLSFGLEALMVFLGVTAGFLLERWKQRRAERKEEAFYRESFRRDLARIQEQLTTHLRESDAWLESMDRAIQRQDPEETRRLLGTLNLADISFPSYVHALNSGGFRVLRSYALRDRLTESALLLDHLQRMDRILETFYLSHVLPFLLRGPGGTEGEETGWVLAQSYRSLLAQKASLLRRTLRELSSLRPLLER